MRALIILKNAGGTGKTQTLSILTDLLKAGGKEISKDEHPNGNDFVAMIQYHNSKVGIITVGDPGTEDFVYSELEKLYKAGCDVIIASSRSRSSASGVYEMLWQYGKENGIATMETSPYRTYEEYHDSLPHETINSMCAHALLGAIDYFIMDIRF
ncbi:MAG: hypothetical protein MRZ38_08995 [Muribaculaceae bacterium]|nr:hypothetical protein [Muribaculaceae bacterium]